MDEPYTNCRIHGPYNRSDGRQHIVLVHPDGHKQTVSYPKFLLEKHIGRYLQKDETVDHIDRDPLNNDFANLQILKRADHARLDAKRADYSEQKFICEVCSTEFALSGKRLKYAKDNNARGRSGPYCSRSCAGKATHDFNRDSHNVGIELFFIEKSPVQETVQVDPAKSENPRSMGIPN